MRVLNLALHGYPNRVHRCYPHFTCFMLLPGGCGASPRATDFLVSWAVPAPHLRLRESNQTVTPAIFISVSQIARFPSNATTAGVDGGIRTGDHRLIRAGLYQLSYVNIFSGKTWRAGRNRPTVFLQLPFRVSACLPPISHGLQASINGASDGTRTRNILLGRQVL